MAALVALVAAIHVGVSPVKKDVDNRHKVYTRADRPRVPGHDEQV